MFALKQILDLEVAKGTKVLCGDDYLDKPLLGITLMDAPDAHYWLREGEFVITTGYPFITEYGDLNKGLLNLIKALIKKKGSGLGIKLGRYIPSLPEEVKQFAEQNRVPILSFPVELTWSELIVPIITEINNRQRVELEKTHNVYELFHQHLTNGYNLQDLAELLEQILQTPTTLYIKNTKHKVDSSSICSEGSVVESLLFERDSAMHTTKKLYFENQVIGGIIMWNFHQELPWQKVAMEQAAAIVILEIGRMRTVAATFQRFRNEFLNQLISGTKEPLDVLVRRAEEVGWDFHFSYRVAVIEDANINLLIKDWRDKFKILDQLQEVLPEFFPGTLSGLDSENRLTFLIPNLSEEMNNDNDCEYITKLKQIFNGIKSEIFLGGLGRLYRDPSDISRSYNEALICLKSVEKKLPVHFSRDQLTISTFSDLNIERIIFTNNPYEESKQLAEECLGAIYKYDLEKNGQLLLTLQVFLEDGKIPETAGHLYVHKNTVKYRLQLIHELTGLNPEKIKDQILLKIALSFTHFSA
jgi:purine catabolism regulator